MSKVFTQSFVDKSIERGYIVNTNTEGHIQVNDTKNNGVVTLRMIKSGEESTFELAHNETALPEFIDSITEVFEECVNE